MYISWTTIVVWRRSRRGPWSKITWKPASIWYIVLPGCLRLREIFCSARTTVNFGEQDISKCLNNLFLVLEQTNRVSFASFSNYNVTHMINCAVGGIVFKRHHNQMITECLYNLFLAMERIHRISLAVLVIYSVLFTRVLTYHSLNKFFE